MSRARKWLALLMAIIMLQIPVVHAEDMVASSSDIPKVTTSDEQPDEPVVSDAEIPDGSGVQSKSEAQENASIAADTTDCEHNYGAYCEYNDAYSDRYVCANCGETLWTIPHYSYCDEPGICYNCGTTGLTDYEIAHYGNYHYGYDADCHWSVCDDCGSSVSGDLFPHYSSCSDPYVCLACRQEYDGSNASHGNYHYDYDADSHWWACDDCGNPIMGDPGEHYSSCLDPYICLGCGHEYDGSNASHGSYHYEHDSDSHQQVCDDCGETIWSDVHYAYCDAPDTCYNCGETGITPFYISHNGSTHPEHNATGHWDVCDGCGEKRDDYVSQHYGYCTNPNVCAYCGGEYEAAWITHESYHMGYNSQYHYDICDACGEITWTNEHSAACTARDVCEVCGASYSGNNLSHNGDEYTAFNENVHWIVCSDCGNMKYEPWEHYASCNEPNKCGYCGWESDNLEVIYHSGDSHIEHDASGHREICDNCGRIIWQGEHNAPCNNPNVCDYCGGNYENMRLYHIDEGWHWEHDADKHWIVCGYCGEISEEPEAHYSYCDNPGICGRCDAVLEEYEVRHYNEECKYNAENHWWACSACGENIQDFGPHYGGNCADEPAICALCRKPYTVGSFNHPNTHYEYVNDERHSLVCDDCGIVLSSGEHYGGNCTDGSTVCYKCGEAYTGSYVYHNNTHSEDMGQYHITICDDCGETLSAAKHYVLCRQNQGVCQGCGAQLNGGYLVDHVGYMETKYDENEHWTHCLSCGTDIWQGEHIARCDNPGICNECGAPYTGDNVFHSGDGYYEISGNTHQWVCLECGETLASEPHHVTCTRRNQSICSDCGAELTGEINITHSDLTVVECDDAQHWTHCLNCGEDFGFEAHYTDAGDPEGVCSLCGAEYGAPETPAPTAEVTATPAPTAQGTALPSPTVEATITPAPMEEATATPAVGSSNAAVTATEDDGQSFIQTFINNALPALFDVPYEIVREDNFITVIMTAPTIMDESDYRLTFYQDFVLPDCFNLMGIYKTSAPQEFDAWRLALQGISELHEDHPYQTFIEFAVALIRTCLPALSAQDADELILTILQSTRNDVEIPDALSALTPDEDVTVLCHHQAEGYDFFIMIQNDRLMFGMVASNTI